MEKALEQFIYFWNHGLCKLAEEFQNVTSSTKDSEPVDSQTLLEEFLFNLVKTLNTSYQSSAVPQRWDSSWLASSLLSKLTSDIISTNQGDRLKTEAEFKHILSQLLKSSADSHVFEELTRLYGQVADAKKFTCPAQELSADVHSFLRDSLIAHPIATNTLVQKLLCLWCTSFQGTDNELQGIFKEVLWLCVQNLENERENVNFSLNLTNTLLCLVSVIQISEKNENLLEWLCPRLVYLFDQGILSRQLTYLALSSRESPNWLRALINYEDEHYERCVEDDSNLERVCSRLVDTDGALQVEEIFRRFARTGKHFTEDILDICTNALINERKEIIFTILSNPVLRYLWPIIILHLWNRFSDTENIFSTLNWLIEECKFASDPIVERMNIKLQRSIRIVEWCKKNSSGNQIGNNELLQLANRHSILEVMCQCTDLIEEDKWCTIIEMLQRHGEETGNDTLSTGCWDVATFNGFCILTAAFKAIVAGMELQALNTRISRQRIYSLAEQNLFKMPYFSHNFPSVSLDHPLLKTEGSDLHNIEAQFFESVTRRLDFIQYLICNLFPLHFRVEILENLFSLLFLRHEDIREEDLSDSCGEEDDRDFDVKSLECGERIMKPADQQPVLTSPVASHFQNIPRIETWASSSSPTVQSHSSHGLLSPPIKVPNSLNTSTPKEDDLNLNWSWPRRKTKDQSMCVSSLPTNLVSALEARSESHTKPSSTAPDITPKTARTEMNRAISLPSPQPAQTSSINTDARQHAKLRKFSTNTSCRSRTNSSFIDIGFVCNEFLVRDVLSCLKDCLVDTSAAYYSSLSQVQTHTTCGVVSSISPESVQERLKRLSQSVSEAAWRLQLITIEDFTQNVGKFSSREPSLAGIEAQANLLYCSVESESESDEDDRAVEAKEQPIAKTKVQKPIKRNKSETEKSSESGSQSNATGGGSASGSSNRHVRRGKCQARQPPFPLSSPTTINLMLSSPSSLVVQCLAREDLIKAHQIIKMPGMEDSYLAAEVKFTTAYQTLLKKLGEKNELLKHDGQALTTGKVTSATLQAIKIAAMAGVQSTVYTSLVETFLSATSLPSIPGATSTMKDFPQAVAILQGADNNEAMVAIDLALTVGNSNENSASLLDVACKYSSFLQSAASPKVSPKPGKQVVQPLGFVGFTCSMINLLREVNKNRDFILSAFPRNISLNRIVRSEQFSLNHRVFEEEILFWSELQSAVHDFELTLSDEMNQCKALKAKGVAPTLDIQNKIPHLAFRKLLNLLFSEISFNKDLPTNKRSQVVPKLNYLQDLYTHLQLLSSLLTQNIPTHKGLLSPATYFDVLEKNLVYHIGQLVFECDVPPARLEPITQQMKVDLLYDIVCNCCPKIPVKIHERKQRLDGKLWGRITLNSGLEQWIGPVRHPEIAVRALLSDVLEVLHQERHFNEKSCSLNNDIGTTMITNPALKRILEETQELERIDLNLLSSGDETLAFYLNLANLMWLHGLLTLEISSKVLLEKHGHVSGACDAEFGLVSKISLQRFIAQKTIGFNVGQLGFVSLFDLHKQLLRKEICFLSLPASKMFASANPCTKNIWYSTLPFDSRVLFALTNGRNGSPKVQVLVPENIDHQLDKIMVEFLSSSVHVLGNCVRIPEQLSWFEAHRKTILPENELIEEAEEMLASNETEDKGIPVNNEKSVVDFLLNHSSGKLFEDLSHLHDLGCGLTVVVNEEIQLGITLEYPCQDECQSLIMGIDSKETKNIWQDHNVIQDHVIKYLEQHCWLLSVLVTKMYRFKTPLTPSPVHFSNDKTKCFESSISLPTMTALKPVYGDNGVLTALHYLPDTGRMWTQLNALTEEHEWLECLSVLRALPEKVLATDPKLQMMNDIIVHSLASKLPTADSPTPWVYCQHIGDVLSASATVLTNLCYWPAHGCKEALLSLLDDARGLLDEETTTELECQLKEIQIYDQISSRCASMKAKSWYDVRLSSENNPTQILNQLIDAKEISLVLEWIELRHVSPRLQQLVSAPLLFLLLDTEPPDFTSVSKFLHSLLTIQAVTICEELIKQLRSNSTVTFVVNYILSTCLPVLTSDDVLRYRHLLIGVRMLAVLPSREQSKYLDLVEQPHLIVEQFVMNTRLDILERMLRDVHLILGQLPIVSPVSVNSIDLLLRQYAAKALDFRVIQPRSKTAAVSNEEKSMSLSMTTFSSEEFVMPANVPTKDQWVPNDEVTECMCCNAVAFSMFSRRHHCRRCGRVVCSSCSRHRLQVIGYGDVMVRVCNTCYDAQQSDRSSDASSKEPTISLQGSISSVARDSPWRLTLDSLHNSTVREEFGYEHAPSVSLCLAILKMHSEQTAYPRFLLDSCEDMLQLLQPIRPGTLNREVDHSLVIRMVRALIIAAKVKYARSGLNTGVAHCDQLLSQADLLSELVQSDCSYLITGEALTGHALRRLRDRLVEEELWSLAMDVSTKGGLERTGVWAAWGKTSLKSGRWGDARQKFSHCLEKITDKGPRPLRNPPLLLEIIHILEAGTFVTERKARQQPEKSQTANDKQLPSNVSPALAILHTLSSLKEIAEGRYPQALSPSNMVIIGPKLDPLFYEECCYYLKTYGSNAGILAFYLRHDDMAATLKHVLAQNVEAMVFYDHVYMPCLRRGTITNLHQALEANDSTLLLWKVYLCHTCSQLERHGFLNVLYQLQLFMKDLVRASMTCIRFYQSGARNYTDLAANLDHLQRARSHLQAEHETRWGSTGRRKSTSSSSSFLPMKLDARDVDHHISTISQQIEVTKFLHASQHNTDSELVPTLFGTNAERLQVAVLVIMNGKNVEEGFGTAFRIIQDYRLEARQVYRLAGKQLALDNRLVDVQQLIRCIQTSGAGNMNETCDEVLATCIRLRWQQTDPGNIEILIKMMSEIGNKISAYIDCHQLKSAYLLAVKFDRLDDVRRIYHEAERLGQSGILKICAKKLSQTNK